MSLYTIWDGMNSAALARDEYNGAGVNFLIDAVWWDAVEVFIPLVAQETFWGDVDICIRAERRTVTVKPEKTTICVGD